MCWGPHCPWKCTPRCVMHALVCFCKWILWIWKIYFYIHYFFKRYSIQVNLELGVPLASVVNPGILCTLVCFLKRTANFYGFIFINVYFPNKPRVKGPTAFGRVDCASQMPWGGLQPVRAPPPPIIVMVDFIFDI